MRTYSSGLKITSSVTLAFFLWSFGPIYSAVAFAAEGKQKAESKAQSADTSQSLLANGGSAGVSQTSSDRFEKALESIRENVGKAGEKADKGEDNAKELETIKAKRAEIESADIEFKKELADTEKKLKDAKLPQEILDRHYKFVKHYDDNLTELKTNLDDIEKLKSDSRQLSAALTKAKAHLEKTKAPSKHVPLDPNNLPHRTVKAKEKAPRLKKEDFEKDFPPQKKAVKLASLQALSAANDREWTRIASKSTLPLTPNNSRIQIASNGSLAGLLYSDSNLPRPLGERIEVRGGFDFAPFAINAFATNSELNTTNYQVAQAIVTPPTADDLAETPEVQFTPEIRAKAQELGSNPVKIYEYVKNNFFFEPYYGSLKGASETFAEKAGNDFDQASLLIALLRSANIPAKYEYGTVEIPIERVKKWLGVESDTVVGDILASNGIPVSLIVEGGKISKVQLEHVWVTAWVSYDNYRGQPGSQNKTWIPLDPSFKQVRYTRGPDLKAIMNFDPTAFMNELKSNSTYSASGYYVSNVNEAFIQQKLAEYQTNLSNYVTTNMPNATPQDLVGKFDILYEKFGILPATLPYKTIVKGVSYSEVPDVLRLKLQININSPKVFGIFGTVDINYQANLSQLAGKKITISYQPATSTDDAALKNYGSLSAVPAYLVNMDPVLMIDGVTVATGGEIGLGDTQQINLTFLSPNVSTDIASHTMTAGGYHAIGINVQRIPKALLQKQTDRMQQVKAYLESILSGTPSAPPAGDSRDNLVGDMLYDVAVNYYYNLDAMNDLMSRVTDIIWVRQPSEAMVLMNINVNTMFGIPLSAKPVGMSIDVARNIVSPFHIAGDKNVEDAFKSQSGMNMSAMEHIVFEWMFNVKAVSAVKVLQQANTLSIPVYVVTSQNIGQILPVLQTSDFVKTDVQNAVNAGLKVVIPQTEITLDNWRGTGYIIQNGAYKISGGLNGGSTVCTDNCYFNADNPCVLPDHPSNPWRFLLDDIDKLLTIANVLLYGKVDLQSMADELCALLQGISPDAPGAIKAEEILRQFRSDVILMVLVINQSAWGSPDLPIVTVIQEILLRCYGFEGDIFQYVGYFTIHYLYEYVVLFRAGLINAFPDMEY